MEIREDFKVDFDGWKKEAIGLCRKSIPLIFVLSLFLPFMCHVVFDILRKATADFSPAISYFFSMDHLLLWFFSMFSAFYTLFYFKRVDFEESKNILNILRDIMYTYKYFLEYVKIHAVFFYILFVFTIIATFVGNANNIPYQRPDGYLHLLSNSLAGPFIAFYFIVCITKEHLFGLIYIGYGMVNKEGAKILTLNAFRKYRELERFVQITSLKITFLYFLCVMIMVLAPNDIIKVVIELFFILVGTYYTAIYYLISRDLYGGKKQKQKVTEKVEDINGVPLPV